MNYIEQLKALGVTNDATVYFTKSDYSEVLHYRDGYVDEAMAETGIAAELASYIASGPFYKHGNEILNEMRENDLLDDYDRGEFEFESFVESVISENYFDCDWIDRDLHQWDYKRGKLDLSFTLSAPFSLISENPSDFVNMWGFEVSTHTGSGNEVTINI